MGVVKCLQTKQNNGTWKSSKLLNNISMHFTEHIMILTYATLLMHLVGLYLSICSTRFYTEVQKILEI